MNRRHVSQVDEASLQTDVMRFMAIVAFCLIAILAMVRNVEGPPSPTVVEAPPAQPPVAQPRSEPDEPVSTVTEEVIAQAPEPRRPLQATPRPIPPQLAVAQQKPTPRPETSKPETSKPEPSPAVPNPVVTSVAPPITPTAADQPEQKTREDEGLTLRFETEADFLRLVAKGKVAVYAFDQKTFLALQSNFEFRQAQPPTQVYELEYSTIPRHMSTALPSGASAQELKWAVGLPPRVQSQIQNYVQRVQGGELLINRFEEVRHVAR